MKQLVRTDQGILPELGNLATVAGVIPIIDGDFPVNA